MTASNVQHCVFSLSHPKKLRWGSQTSDESYRAERKLRTADCVVFIWSISDLLAGQKNGDRRCATHGKIWDDLQLKLTGIQRPGIESVDRTYTLLVRHENSSIKESSNRKLLRIRRSRCAIFRQRHAVSHVN